MSHKYLPPQGEGLPAGSPEANHATGASMAAILEALRKARGGKNLRTKQPKLAGGPAAPHRPPGPGVPQLHAVGRGSSETTPDKGVEAVSRNDRAARRVR